MENSSLFIECWFVSYWNRFVKKLFTLWPNDTAPSLVLVQADLASGSAARPASLISLSRRLGAADHRLADTLRGILDAAPDLLGAALDLRGTFPRLGVIRRAGRRRRHDQRQQCDE